MRFIGTSTRHVLMALAEASLLALLVVALVAAPAFAGRGGNGGGKGKPGGTTLTATVVVSPNPVPANSGFRITGCGYTPGGGVQFNLYAPGVTAVWGGVADSAGCLYNAVGWASAPGTARLDVLQNSVTLVASTTFQIS